MTKWPKPGEVINRRAKLKAISYELKPEGSHTRLITHYSNGKRSEALFVSRDDARLNGEQALNPPFMVIKSRLPVNARLANEQRTQLVEALTQAGLDPNQYIEEDED